MSMNKVKLSQVIKDFIITSDGDDYVNNVSDYAIRNFALRGIREIGFDLGKKIKSIKRTIDTTNDTIALPDDFVDLLKFSNSSSSQSFQNLLGSLMHRKFTFKKIETSGR